MSTNSTTRTILLGAAAGFAISGALAAGLVLGIRNASTTSSDSGDDAGVIAPMFVPKDDANRAETAEAPGQGAGVENPQPSMGGAAAETPAQAEERVPSTLNDKPAVEVPLATTEPAGPASSPREPLPPVVTPTPTPATEPVAPPVSPGPSSPVDGGAPSDPASAEPPPAPGGGSGSPVPPLMPVPAPGPCVLVRCDLLPPIEIPPLDLEPDPAPLPIPPIDRCDLIICGLLPLLPPIDLDPEPEPMPFPLPGLPPLIPDFSGVGDDDEDEEETCPPGVLCLPDLGSRLPGIGF